MLDSQLYYNVLSFSWAFLISVFAIPSIIYVAHVKNLLDEPNLRTVHESLTPRLGGLAIFAGFMSSLTIFGQLDNGVKEILAGSIIIFFIGLKDDIVSVSAFKKFFVQVLATGIVMFMADVRIRNFQGLLGIYQLDDGISYAFTFLVIIGITNAINLIDGLDGLAGTIIMIATATFGFYFFRYGGDYYSPYADLAFCLLGSIVGFLRYNLNKAIIFMGDTGSLVCGFVVSILAVQFVEMKAIGPVGAPIGIAILIIPIMDTLRVFLLRILVGVSPFSADKNHIHHRLIELGFSQLSTVFMLAAINIVAIALAVHFSYLGNNKVLFIVLTFAFVFSILIEILKRKTKK
ncbi:MAG: undecaprenyl/decaprenyl-phosphate alpha-N-acetylglucosaminyl 1-phosphate transferase [Cytophagaceae bacterium]|nr:undecaprenyl/decaprenyl-phosphate alpha-N-acetylglucosaminyl 1-phosphate transferase [Cytophagaceae bacterium]